MNILVLGSGAREHAVAYKFSESNKVEKVFVSPGNAGISKEFECVELKSFGLIAEFVQENNIDMVFVGPEQPLSEGVVDFLEEENIVAIGPTKSASQIESSKAFAKDLMKEHKVPTAEYEVFSKYEDAKTYINSCKFPVVFKADGLAAGKGVVIVNDLEQAEKELTEFMLDSKFGEAGNKLVIEEFLEGWETSVFAFCDGTNFVTTIFSMDHKQLNENDEGPNTGGMGAVAPIKDAEQFKDFVEQKVFEPVLTGMKEKNATFKGVLYCGLMITADGPKVIEFNCRFGDPETQVVLPLLDSDFASVCIAIADETIDEMELTWKDQYAVNVVSASGGYPGNYAKGLDIEVGELSSGSKVYYAGVKEENGKLLTNGGRVLGITSIGYNRESVIEKAYEDNKLIKFSNRVFRKDIGKRTNR